MVRAVSLAVVAVAVAAAGCSDEDSARDGKWRFTFKTDSGSVCTDCVDGCVRVGEKDATGEVTDGKFSFLHPTVSTPGLVQGSFEGNRVSGTAELGYNGCESKASHAVKFSADCVNDTQCKGTWEAPKEIIGSSTNPGGFRGTVIVEKQDEGGGGGCESGHRTCTHGCCPPGTNCCAAGCCSD